MSQRNMLTISGLGIANGGDFSSNVGAEISLVSAKVLLGSAFGSLSLAHGLLRDRRVLPLKSIQVLLILFHGGLKCLNGTHNVSLDGFPVLVHETINLTFLCASEGIGFPLGILLPFRGGLSPLGANEFRTLRMKSFHKITSSVLKLVSEIHELLALAASLEVLHINSSLIH